MKLGIVGKKVGMTTIFNEAGLTVPITVVDTSDCYVTQVKTKETDGYAALQVAYGFRKPQNVDKARLGHYKKANVPARLRSKEIRVELTDDLSQFKAGQKLSASMFAKGDIVDVIGTTKGKGFAGVMKRYHWHGADATHGVSKYFRHGGSNGANTFPGRVLKSKGMPGQLGNSPRTIQKLTIVEVRPDENLIFIKGGIPGPDGGYVTIRPASKIHVKPAERTYVLA